MIVMILKKKVNRQSKCNFFVTAFMGISDNIDIDSCHIIVLAATETPENNKKFFGIVKLTILQYGM